MDAETRKKADAILKAFDNHPGLLKAVLTRLEDRRIRKDQDKGYARGMHHGIAEALHKWARKYRMRSDWHESDEQGVRAEVVGTKLDNAFGNHVSPKAVEDGWQEIVIRVQHGRWADFGSQFVADDTIDINLANLLALACRYYEDYLEREATENSINEGE